MSVVTERVRFAAIAAGVATPPPSKVLSQRTALPTFGSGRRSSHGDAREPCCKSGGGSERVLLRAAMGPTAFFANMASGVSSHAGRIISATMKLRKLQSGPRVKLMQLTAAHEERPSLQFMALTPHDFVGVRVPADSAARLRQQSNQRGRAHPLSL